MQTVMERLTPHNLVKIDVWQEDIRRIVKQAGLDHRNHWAATNQFIYSRLDEDNRTLCTDIVPPDYDEAGTIDTNTIMMSIEARLTSDDLREAKLVAFHSAVQKPGETPWGFHITLFRKYEKAQIRDERRYVDQFTEGLTNQELRRKLLDRDQPLITILQLKEALSIGQAALARLVAQSPSEPFSTVGLGLGEAKTVEKLAKRASKLEEAMDVDHLSQLRTQEERGPISVMRQAPEELFFMGHMAEAIRTAESLQVRDYWENGVGEQELNEVRSGSRDYSNMQCFHCKRKGHIKANCPERTRVSSKPWERRNRYDRKSSYDNWRAKSYGKAPRGYSPRGAGSSRGHSPRGAGPYRGGSGAARGHAGTGSSYWQSRGKEGAKRERGLHQMSDEENEDEEEENPNPEQLPIDNSDF